MLIVIFKDKMEDTIQSKTQDNTNSTGKDKFDRLCLIANHQKVLLILLVLQTLLSFTMEVFENENILLISLAAFVSISIYYVVTIVKLSRMLNKTPMTILYGFLGVIFSLNFIPFIALVIQGNREFKKHGIKTGYNLVTKKELCVQFEKT